MEHEAPARWGDLAKTKTYTRPFDEVWTKALEAIDECDFKLIHEAKEAGNIKASRKPIAGYGEGIEVSISRLDQQETKIFIYSHYINQYGDFGRILKHDHNKEHVNNFFDSLEKKLGLKVGKPAPPEA